MTAPSSPAAPALAEARRVVMIGPNLNAKGGMTSVVNVYRESGLFRDWNVLYLTTHDEGHVGRKLRIAVTSWLRLVSLLARRRVSLLHAHVSERVSFWRKSVYLLTAMAFRCPVIFHLHGANFVEFFRDELNAPGRWLCRLLLRRSAYVIALSSQWVENVRVMCPDANVVQVFNPVSFGPKPVAGGGEARQTATLLFLGRFGQRKGIYDLLQAVAMLRQEFPDIVLVAGGDGEQDQVVSSAAALGLSGCVNMLGWVRGEAKCRLLRTATLYVLPSYNEGLPMAILEAMAAGLPVVASNVGGIPDAITDGVEGFLVAPGDVPALAAVLRRLLRDPALRALCSSNAAAKAQRTFAVEAVIPKVTAIYERLCAKPQGLR